MFVNKCNEMILLNSMLFREFHDQPLIAVRSGTFWESLEYGILASLGLTSVRPLCLVSYYHHVQVILFGAALDGSNTSNVQFVLYMHRIYSLSSEFIPVFFFHTDDRCQGDRIENCHLLVPGLCRQTYYSAQCCATCQRKTEQSDKEP